MGFRLFSGKTDQQKERPYGQGTPRPIGMVNVDLRDGQQSLLATRITTAEFVPVLDEMDQVGYQQYPDDVVEKFVELAAKNGIDIFEIFDGMNDVRNTETAVRAAKKQGKKVAACLAVCQSPVHTAERYVGYAKEYLELGADMGYPPLATPFAQMVGSQATFNVLLGERYKMLMDWVKEYVSFIAPVYIYPGECEMEAIFLGMRRGERGEEEYKIYRKKRRPPIWEQPVE